MGQFETTRWTIIVKARSAESAMVREAYAHLCTAYWGPLFAYFRGKGVSPEDARDLVQELFARIIERKSLESVSAEKGRFRTYLLRAAENLLHEERARQQAQKRIPRDAIVQMDLAEAEARYGAANNGSTPPEMLYDQEWAVAVLRNAFEAARGIYDGKGRGDRFTALSPYLTSGDETVPYAELAEATGMTVGAIKSAVHRMRRRFRRCISEQVADTVASEEEWEDEMRYLLSLFENVSPGPA